MSRKSILITGCSSGIGYDAAHGLRKAGWRVFASCRKEVDCERLRAEGFESPRIDYADSASIKEGLTEVLAATGGTLGALYNNGAYGAPGAVEDVPRDALREIFETNLFGVHELTTRVIPVMRAQGHGRIVNCSSVLGYVALRWRGPYVATKHAMEGLTDSLRLEMSDTPIKVILIEPGLITTKFRQNGIPHFEKWIDTENSARKAQYDVLRKRIYAEAAPGKLDAPASAVTRQLRRALESPRPRARYRVTRLANVALVLRRLLPTRATDWILRRV
jgi:NAD(P)-dependent dehydrogenase (short-subunit alcohol dehydrogenase family)